MLSEVPFGNDGDYSDTAMLACANGFLANALGNLQVRARRTKAPRTSLRRRRDVARRPRAALTAQPLRTPSCGVG